MASKVEQETGRKPHKWLCETVFENIRKKHFADCPSRIYGIYLCETLGDAISFRNNIRKGIGSIFEVSIPDNVDYFDMNLFTQAETLLHGSVNDREMFQVCIGLANRYWAKKNDNLIVEKEYIYENIVLIGTKIM